MINWYRQKGKSPRFHACWKLMGVFTALWMSSMNFGLPEIKNFYLLACVDGVIWECILLCSITGFTPYTVVFKYTCQGLT